MMRLTSPPTIGTKFCANNDTCAIFIRGIHSLFWSEILEHSPNRRVSQFDPNNVAIDLMPIFWRKYLRKQ